MKKASAIGFSLLMAFIFSSSVWAAVRLETKHLPQKQAEKVPVSTIEDLMREHGVLSRVLLIYENIIERINNGKTFPSDALIESTEIIRAFIQSYHEKLEENYIFVRFQKAHDRELIKLVKVLKKQHKIGHKIIDDMINIENKIQDPSYQKKLINLMDAFIHMYRAHKAKEDTILFPAFHNIVTASEYGRLGDVFEAEEEQLFGEKGFEKIVKQVGKIEQSLNMFKLSNFTPRGY